MGGGYPFQHNFCLDEQKFDPATFFASLAGVWGSSQRPPLLIEPGRWIAAPSFVLTARVVSRKPRLDEPTILVLDTGTNHNVMGAFYEHQWAFQEVEAFEENFRICGPLCMEDDALSGPMFGAMPKSGSLVAMLNAGAYSISLARSFIQPLPTIVRASENGRYEELTSRTDSRHGVEAAS